MGFLIVAIIIFALVQRRKYRRIYRGYKRDKWSRRWERMQPHEDATREAGRAGQASNDKWDKWSRQWQDWERWAHDARHQAADVGQKVASKLEMAEAKLRREAERLRGGSAAPGDATRPGAAQSSTASWPDQRPEFRQESTRESAQDSAKDHA